MKITQSNNQNHRTSPFPLLAGEGDCVEYHRKGEVRILPKRLMAKARKLRIKQTPHETKLWARLRSRRFYELKFRRQHPIGQFIVDFCCMEKNLVIEVDGSQHNEDKNLEKDTKRDNLLAVLDYTVLRIWNNEVDQNMEGILEEVAELCRIIPKNSQFH